MWLYLIIFFIPVLAFFYRKRTVVYGKPIEGFENSVIFLFLIFISLMIFVGISDMLGGYDRYIYGELFDELADNMRNGSNIFSSFIFFEYPKEIGYDFLNVIIAYLTANRYIFILILTVIIYTLTFISFKRYMTNYPYAVVLFLALMFFFTFTYLRQILAASIAWLSIRYIIDRKFWKFLLVIIVACLFHNSAIILFPFYFLPIRKYRIGNILLVMLICLILGVTGITSTLYDAYGDFSGSTERSAEYATEAGFRIAYMVEALFFLSLILLNYRKIPMDKTRLVLCNMALTFCGILLFFIKSENGGRLSWFYMIGLISTLTYILAFNVRRKQLAILMICVSLFLYLRIYTSWQVYLNLYPYKTFFTNGYREGDYSWENYEYDHGYEKDKFYR
jgi:hypothetical protein